MKKILPYFVFALVMVAVMIPLYRRGFVFLLDMVWPPAMHLSDFTQHGYQASFPILAIIKGLSLLIPLDVVQKIVLSLILFLSGVFMYQFFTNIFCHSVLDTESKQPRRPLGYGAPTTASEQTTSNKNTSIFSFLDPKSKFGMTEGWATLSGIMYMLNPWVYERFLAGHWFVLLGYALFPLMVKLFWQMMRDKKRSDVAKFAVAFALYPMASLHWAYIAGFAFGVVFLAYLFRHFRERSVWSVFSLIAGVWLVFNSFWLVSGFFGGEQTFSKISFDDFKAFATLTDPSFGVFFNALSMYGFWQTNSILPKDLNQYWWIYTGILLALFLVGAWRSWKERITVGKAVSIAFIPVLLVAVGYAHDATRPIVEFLYTILPGFKGLRETEKLVGLVVFAYALLVPFGMNTVVERVGQMFSASMRKMVVITGSLILLLIPFATTSTMVWGFQGRVVPQEYPTSWHDAKRLIENDPESGKILVFPWHGYMSLSLAQYRIALNPASGFFGRSRVIAGKTIENAYLKETDQGIWDEKVFRFIHGFETLDENAVFLRSSGVTHIVLMKEADWHEQYGFIQPSARLEQLFDSDEIAIFEVR